MLTYNELVKKKSELENRKIILQDTQKSKESQRVSHESELNQLNNELDNSIKTAYNLALKEEISKSTMKYDNMISKLSNNRDVVLSNKKRRLDNITYESYAPLVKDGLSVEDCMNKCEKIKDTLRVQQGNRLHNMLSSHMSIDSPDLYSLEDIHTAFDDLDYKLSKLSNAGGILGKFHVFISGISVKEDDKVQTISYLLACVVFILLFFYFTPLLVILLLVLFSYNVYRSFYMYNCLAFVNGILTNLATISDSIEEGIKSKMEEDRLVIEHKFKSKLDTIDGNIEKLESKIIEVTEDVTNSFHFNTDRIKESFLIKEKSLKERISLLKTEYINLNSSIEDINKEISDINQQIIKLSKSIYDQYYPSDLSGKSSLYPIDLLFSIEDNKPNIFTLPTGSACFIFKDEECMFDFITLYLMLLYSNMFCSSFTTHVFDSKYVGTRFIEFTALNNLLCYSDYDNMKVDIEELRVEMGKRISVLAGTSISEYNKEMIKEESVPLSYHIVLDLFTDSDKISDEYKQLLINGFNTGIVLNSFILESDIDYSSNSKFFNMLPLFKDFYMVSPSGVSKKSKIFFENKKKK